MKSLSGIVFLACVCLLCGCGQTIVVHRAVKPASTTAPTAPDPSGPSTSKASKTGASEQVERVKGMPFYIKKSGCQHHTSWLQPIYTLTLTVTFTPDKPPGDSKETPSPFSASLTMTMPLSFYDSDDVANFRALLSKGHLTPPKNDEEKREQEKLVQDIEGEWDDLTAELDKLKYKPFGLNEDKLAVCENNLPNCEVKVENVTEPVLYVDYDTPYYYNSSKPWIGSSQASFKQATDGTLSEGSAQVETKTLQSFLDLFPVKALVSSAAGLASTAAKLHGGTGNVAGTYKFELATTVKVYKHTHTAKIGAEAPPCVPISNDVIGEAYNLTVEEVAQTAEKKGADGNTISINGSIQLPKSSDANAQPQKPK